MSKIKIKTKKKKKKNFLLEKWSILFVNYELHARKDIQVLLLGDLHERYK